MKLPTPLRSRTRLAAATLALALGSGSLTSAADPAAAHGPAIDFNRDIRPVLSDKCYACHGPDEKTRKAGLRLDRKQDAFKALKSGEFAIVAGDPARSQLIKRIHSRDQEEKMPPLKTGKNLTPREIELLDRWVVQGARWQDHWSFVKPERPPRPAVKTPQWTRNEIDSFILARLEQENLSPTPEADPATLIRRVSLDLTGLPPSLDEVNAFLADHAPGGYERLVDRLLKSPRYGEHMARGWLDLARYADSNGYQYDTERSMWRWRDWVIQAFNQNMPFDRFTVEQLAGDLLPKAGLEQKIATGFNRNHPITIEGGIIDEEYRTEYVIDRVSTTSTVWLGLTMGCARCHDHKYDPISQREFYQIFAFFNQVPESGNSGFTPNIPSPTPDQALTLAGLNAALQEREQALALLTRTIGEDEQRWEEETARLPKIEWSLLEPRSMKASSGATLTRLDDQSILAGGVNAGKEVYEIVARVETTGLSAIRLEALTHDSLPHRGPGRHENANFVLSEFELEAVSIADPARKEKVSFASATADYSQKEYEIRYAIDGQRDDGKGWAVDGPTRQENCTAIFVPERPIGFAGGTELRFRLRHEALDTHAIGRFRLAVTSNALVSVPDDLRQLLALPRPKRTEQQGARLRELFLTHHSPPAVRQARAELAQTAQRKRELEGAFSTTMIMQDMTRARDTFQLKRGQYDQPGAKVTADVPAQLLPLPSGAPHNRLGFAQWLVDPAHPLTARVTVNRFWQHYFGTGLVKTAENFGQQGEWPSHPELLDWLARDFIESGWDVKRVQKLIVTSAAYRQSSKVTAPLLEKDPENRLLARGPRLRLTAESIRDNALAVSGLLQERLGGPSVYPYQPPGLWTELNDRAGYSREYANGKGEALYRRSLYTYWKRTVPPPTLQLFDAPEREFCVVRRSRTTTPLQALALLHDPQFVEAARHLAERMMTQGGVSPNERICFAFRMVTARPPTREELQVLRDSFDQQMAEYQADRPAALRLLKVGDSGRNENLDPVEHAAFTAVARLILNLDETITNG